MGNKMPFIVTHDAHVKDELLASGFTIVEDKDGRYVFLNNKTVAFNEDGRAVFTDRLCM